MRNRYFYLKLKLFMTAVLKGKISARKLGNVFWCTAAYYLKRKTSGPAPFILSLELSNACQANCRFCRNDKGEIFDTNPQNPLPGGMPKGTMPLAMALDILGQVHKDTLIAVLYTNGEPLLYQDLPQVIRYCSDHHLLSLIATNGLLLDQNNIQQILDAGIDCIKIQLSGFTQDIYQIQVRQGDVEQLKKNIQMLIKMRNAGKHHTLIMVDYILYNYNRHQLPLVINFFKGLNVIFNIRPGNPRGGLESQEPPQTMEPLPLAISCDWLWKGMQVNFNGDILPCCDAVTFSNSPIYERHQVTRTNIKEVWNGAAARQMRQIISTQGRGAIALCAQCHRKSVTFKW